MKRARTLEDGVPKHNAFAVLMGSEKKKKKRQSQYVQCPAGCGKHVPEFDINSHLDLCMSRSKKEKVATEHVTSTSATNQYSSDDTLQERAASDAKLPPRGDESENESPTSATPTTDKNPDACMQSTASNDNAFSHMMKRSAKVFASPETTNVTQRFHLNADGSVSLTCYSTTTTVDLEESSSSSIAWSAKTQMKQRSRPPVTDDDAEPEKTTIIDLVVTSDIPSYPSKCPRLVKRYSRLSIPVLKSILQKSIRRRKPLPSVRVAMEIADKALGELLRRLPIIILEDSTLHPAFPLLTWLMVADSKGFQIPPSLMIKLFSAIYEMCSCRWQDHLGRMESSSDGKDDKTTPDPTLTSYHTEGSDYAASVGETMVWSILLRAQYGGMKCDVNMLRLYANLWQERFSSNTIPESVHQRLFKSTSSSSPALTTWSQIPTLIHQSAMQTSPSSVGQLCQQGIPCLALTDISTEGVDFHCSSVLDSILSDPELVETCFQRLNKLALQQNVDDSKASRRSWLEGLLKSCMWNYSSGVNRRLPLRDGDKTSKSDQEDLLLALWKELILPRVKGFAERYIKDRLV